MSNRNKVEEDELFAQDEYATLLSIPSYFPHLRSLTVPCCSVLDRLWDTLFSECPEFEAFAGWGGYLNESAIKTLGEKGTNLTSLKLEQWGDVSDLTLGLFPDALRKLTKLRVLHLNHDPLRTLLPIVSIIGCLPASIKGNKLYSSRTSSYSNITPIHLR